MQIDNFIFNAELETVLEELRNQLSINHIQLLQKAPKQSGNSLQIQCPYHGGGTEKKPSAGIRRSDGMFHCFRGDTKVITYEHGAIEIDKLVGNPTHILNGNGVWELVTFGNYGKQPLMKLTLSCNTKKKIIYATPEHEWLIKYRNKKYQTRDLKVGWYLEKCVPSMSLDKVKLDPAGIVHGFCYGDGNTHSHNKDKTKFYSRCYFYNRDDLELKQYFNGKFSKGIAGNGKEYERVDIITNRNLKEVPYFKESESYLLGFLAGYFVADGNCFRNKLTIYSHKYDDLYKIQQICNRLGIMSTEIGVSNISKGQRGCVKVNEDTKGYTLRLVRNTIPDSFFITNKGRDSKQKYTGRNCYKVISVEQTDLIENVYCCQTSTHSFTLENFILTGNCFACNEIHTLPEVISHCFGHEDMGNFGWQWLMKNFATVQKEERKKVELDFSRGGTNSILRNSKSIDFVGQEELDNYRYYHPYWKKRGITDERIIELFDLGYDKKTKCITFPIRDKQGNCLFVARRSVNTKYFNYPQGVTKPLYGLYELCISGIQAKEIIVCESMIDCLLLWQSGYYAVALNGLGNSVQFKQLQGLSCRELILATDSDEAGMKARERIKKNVRNKIIKQVILPDGRKDIGECTKDEIATLQIVF